MEEEIREPEFIVEMDDIDDGNDLTDHVPTVKSRHARVIQGKRLRFRQIAQKCIKWGMFLGIVFLAIFIVYSLGAAAARAVHIFRDEEEPAIRSDALTNLAVMEKVVKAQCPGLGTTRPCSEKCMNAWEFYSNPALASEKKLLQTCNGHKPDDDGGAPFRQCLADITKGLTSTGSDHLAFMQGIASAFGLDMESKDCVCNSDFYSIGHLMRVCPFTVQQYRNFRTAAALNPDASAVCMLPVDNVHSITVPPEKDPVPPSRNQRCICTEACESDQTAFVCCGPECVDTRNNTLHCGRCGNTCDEDLERCHDGECVAVTWDTCNCGAPGHVCKDIQMCYGMRCLNPLTTADATYAQTHLKCDGRAQHKLNEMVVAGENTETWFATLSMVDQFMNEESFFSVMTVGDSEPNGARKDKRDIQKKERETGLVHVANDKKKEEPETGTINFLWFS